MITAAGRWWQRHWTTVVLACVAIGTGLWLGRSAPLTSPVDLAPSTVTVPGP